MSNVVGEMMDLRVRGNELFSHNPRAAAALYTEALSMHRTDIGTFEEYTKSAGNALTCLFKVEDYEGCVSLAREVLAVNPLLAKAYAFLGRCAIVQRKPLPPHEGALQFLCRAVQILPGIGPATLPAMQEALDQLLAMKANALSGNDNNGENNNNNNNNSTTREEVSIAVRQGECGNGVFATTPLPSNLPLCSTQQPFSVCSYEETNKDRICVQCGFVMDSAVLSCTDCDLVAYCSKECANAHKTQHTQYECRSMQRLRDMRVALEARQAERRASSNPSHKDTRLDDAGDDGELFATAMHCITTLGGIQAHREGHERVLLLESHVSEVSQSMAPLIRLVWELFDGNGVERDRVACVVGILRCNALEVADASGLPVGQALHAASIVSYFNHSCAPNCAMDTLTQTIQTIRPIPSGEELTIAYLPQLYWPSRLRREELAGRFFFTCGCVRCRVAESDPFEAALEAAIGAETREDVAAVQEACATLRAKEAAAIRVEDRRQLERLLRDCQRRLYPFHYLCHELRNTLSFVYAVLGDAVACRRSCLEELLLWEALMPGAHPAKRLKIHNVLRCKDAGGTEMGKGEDGAVVCLLPLVDRFAALYDVNVNGEDEA